MLDVNRDLNSTLSKLKRKRLHLLLRGKEISSLSGF